ncbi:uncharacterized protein LOC143231097 isoform X2 [Tachypleus tridentatus]|uniref:uncharacterized protein LOC143231097 isoform X2 n=1 Tax=Tachypleus tridentatus TaxID=6853 RepID=UPI003FD5DDC5
MLNAVPNVRCRRENRSLRIGKETFLMYLSIFLLCISCGETAPQKCLCSVYASGKPEMESRNFIRSKEWIIPDLVCDEGAGETCARLFLFSDWWR